MTSALGPNVLKRIGKEVVGLQQTPLEDIQVLSNYHDLTEIQAWIRGPNNTPYENGYFKIRLVLTEGFPNNPPKGFFTTKIFHPNVSASGEICVNTLKKDWKADVGIAQILLTIKCLLIVPNPESALNEEAGKLLLEDYDDYAKQARLYTKIHAKSGKSEFDRLLQQQQQQQQQQMTSSVNKVAAKSIDTELDKQQLTPTTSPHNVLTTSMVSNTVGITVGDTNGTVSPTAQENGISELKRSAPTETNRPTKQARLDDENTGLDGNKNINSGNKKMAPLTHTQPAKDKKKRSLRRL